jgi:amino acid adenylation domain-containing protein
MSEPSEPSRRRAALSPRRQALLAQRLRAGARAAPPPDAIPRRRGGGPARLFAAQERLWFVDRMQPETPIYNLLEVVELEGLLDRACLEAALGELVRRHEILRSVFVEIDGVPLQVATAAGGGRLPLVDLGALPAPGRRQAALALLAAEGSRPFDLARGPLLRSRLLRLGERRHFLSLDLHHIIADLWSFGVILRDLATLYGRLVAGDRRPLPEPPLQYADFAAWHREWFAGEVAERQLDYWRRRLHGAPLALELPADRPRPAVQSFRGRALPLTVPAVEPLRMLAQVVGGTPFMVVLAAFAVLLGRHSGQEDLLVGSPIAGRTRPELDPLVGLLINLLVLRVELAGNPSFRELLGRVRETTLGAFSHQDLPFERLVETLQPRREAGRPPLVQVAFTLQNAPVRRLELPGLAFTEIDFYTGTSHFDLDLTLVDLDGRLVGSIEWSTDLFDAARVARFAGHLRQLLAAAAAEPGRPISELPLLSPPERQQLLREWNDSRRAAPLAAPFALLFAAVVANGPERVAAGCDGSFVTYGELDRRAGALARALAARGVGPDRLVAVLAGRDLDFLAAVVGIFQAGAAYLPLDPRQPPERLRQVLAESRCSLLLAAGAYAGAVAGAAAEVATLEALLAGGRGRPPAPRGGGDHLAYAVFTSGSTGAPKGVLVTQQGMVNHLLAMIAELGLTAADVVPQTTTHCFDMSVWQFLSPLLAGGRVEIYPDLVVQDPAALLDRADADGAVTLELVPAHARVVVDEIRRRGEARPALAGMRCWFPTAETVPMDLYREWQELYPHIPQVNGYGPAEGSDDVSYYPVPREEVPRDRLIPIGRPIQNVELYVVDRLLAPAPIGVAGELCIGGSAVGRGYLFDPVRTAAAFVPDPFSGRPGDRLYRSGDLACLRGDGNVELLGRLDHQVKIRGFRVEPGEVEAALAAHPGIGQAAVVVRRQPDGEQQLVACFTPAASPGPAGALTAGEARDWLRSRLPAYMVPATFLALPALPLGDHGKIDRRALVEMAAEAPPAATGAEPAGRPPRTPLEEILAGIWADVLHLAPEAIGPEDHFFDLGGNSLATARVAARVREVCGVEVPLRRLFEAPTVAGLAAEVEAARRAGLAPLPPIRPLPRGEGAPLPLSFAQERLWFLDQLDPGSTAYSIPAALRVRGPLRPPALGAAWREIVRRHEVLRTTYPSRQGVAMQRIVPPSGPPLPIVDLGGLPDARREAAARRLASENAARPFDLAAEPPLRTLLARLAAEDHLALVNVHHIASDAWSLDLLLRELGALYGAAAAGRPSPLPELPVQYADYAAWQRESLAGEALAAQLAWWRERLAGIPQALELPADRPRPLTQTWRGASCRFVLPGLPPAALREAGRRSGATLFMVLLAAWGTLLHRLAGQPRLLVGSPVAGRTRRETEGLIGLFVNLLVLPLELAPELPFASAVARAREAALGAYAHQELPFEKLVEEIQPQRDVSRSPLVQVMLVLLDGPALPPALAGLSVSAVELEAATAKLDLSLALSERDGRLEGEIEYSTDLFDRAHILRLAGQLGQLLAAATASPERPIGELPLLAAAERQQLLAEWNDSRVAAGGGWRPGSRDLCLHQLFEAQVARTPEAEALRCQGAALTYRQLDAAAGRLARRLRRHGVGPEEVVGVMLERSLELVVALLGALKAGGAYLPLDPSSPPERLSYYLTDAAPAVVVTSAELAARLPQLPGAPPPLLVLDLAAPEADGAGEPAAPTEAPERDRLATADNLAYVIYTSGSTGRPKGAMNAHCGAVNRIVWMQEAYGLGPEDRVLQKTPASFDVSVWEFFWPLAVGARLVMARPEGHRDPSYLGEVIGAEGITTLHFVPSMLRAFFDAAEAAGERSWPAACGAVRRVMASGEELAGDLVARFGACFGQAELHNLYGPTEAAVDVTCWACRRAGEPAAAPPPRVPIGRPIANLRLHVLEPGGAPAPLGMPGELHIGGVGVGRGYLGRPELTAERFVPDPIGPEPGGRLYRTGDLARHRGDGAIEFLGRLDHQVKIRGLRIELGEIEQALRDLPEVGAAAVVVREYAAGDRRLIAYVVAAPGADAAPDALRDGLRRTLPEGFLPSLFVALDALPLTPSGKVDRQTLARFVPDAAAGARAYVPPETAVELALAAIWADLLGVERVGLGDGFFELGGHSLLATRLISRVRESFGIELPLRAVFEAPTLGRFAEAVLDRQLAAHDEAELERLLAELEAMPDETVGAADE